MGAGGGVGAGTGCPFAVARAAFLSATRPLALDAKAEALLTEDELRKCLEHTILSLSELQSSVLVLRERQGLELEEICNLLTLSLSNVRVLLHRARLKVFATVEHFEETGEC